MLKTIDLFAGAGGLSYGFESTGEFLIVAAAENNKNARKTYIENHKGRNDIRMIKEELDSNEIIYEIKYDPETGKIIAQVKSYSVIEYVNKILGDDYKKNNEVVNSLWFGVPQERRRFIMIGVRSDIIQQEEIEMPKDNGADIVTVGQAIEDLIDYEVNEEDNEPEKILYASSTQNLSDYARIMREGSVGISNHIVPRSRDKAKASHLAQR